MESQLPQVYPIPGQLRGQRRDKPYIRIGILGIGFTIFALGLYGDPDLASTIPAPDNLPRTIIQWSAALLGLGMFTLAMIQRLLGHRTAPQGRYWRIDNAKAQLQLLQEKHDPTPLWTLSLSQQTEITITHFPSTFPQQWAVGIRFPGFAHVQLKGFEKEEKAAAMAQTLQGQRLSWPPTALRHPGADPKRVHLLGQIAPVSQARIWLVHRGMGVRGLRRALPILAVGTVLLASGMLLGGIWADTAATLSWISVFVAGLSGSLSNLVVKNAWYRGRSALVIQENEVYGARIKGEDKDIKPDQVSLTRGPIGREHLESCNLWTSWISEPLAGALHSPGSEGSSAFQPSPDSGQKASDGITRLVFSTDERDLDCFIVIDGLGTASALQMMAVLDKERPQS